ncbi:MAG: LytR family transcriptional regulator [Gemmatimonadetes bacterium]|nr:MAG: LytR family transcriptional regulator [Gemmatimonadota bacterium]
MWVQKSNWMRGKKGRVTVVLSLVLVLVGGGTLLAFVPGQPDAFSATEKIHLSSMASLFNTNDKSIAEASSDPMFITREMDINGRPKPVRVEVLNGCGLPGVAKTVTDYLRDHGFDVVNIDNARSFHYEETVIIDRVGDRSFAELVGKTIKSHNVIQQQDPARLLEVTLIIGQDYPELFSFLKNYSHTP